MGELEGCATGEGNGYKGVGFSNNAWLVLVEEAVSEMISDRDVDIFEVQLDNDGCSMALAISCLPRLISLRFLHGDALDIYDIQLKEQPVH